MTSRIRALNEELYQDFQENKKSHNIINLNETYKAT